MILESITKSEIEKMDYKLCMHYFKGCNRNLKEGIYCDGRGEYYDMKKHELIKCKRYAEKEEQLWRSNI